MKLSMDNQGKDGSQTDPLYYAIFADDMHTIADTLNCHHTIAPDEQRQWMNTLVHRYNIHDVMLDALERLVAETAGCLESFQAEVRPAISNTNYSILVDRIAKAREAVSKAKETTE